MCEASEARAAPLPVALSIPVLAGAAVAVIAGVYGRVHDPTGENIVDLFFSSTANMKAWLATLAVALAVFQLVSALKIYGRLLPGRSTPSWLGDVHRLSGTLAFLATLPVAYHCLWSFGYQTGDTRVWVHSLVGCVFYGALTTKVFVVRNHALPGWALPVAGGLVFAVLTAAWATSALWLFTEVGVEL